MSEVSIDKEIAIMQTHLKELRKLAGWTSEELGNKLGMSKQAISALENGSTKLNQLHYLALIHLFETECKENPKNEALIKVMELLFNDPDYYEAHKDDIDKNITDVAKAIGSGLSVATIGLLTAKLIIPLAAPLGVGIAVAGAVGGAVGNAVGGAVGDVVGGAVAGVSSWTKRIMQLGKKK